MAKKFLSPLNLLNLTADPGTATEGDFYWNSSTNKLRIYFDGAWADVSSSGAGSGDVVGPSSSINNNIILFDGTTGKLIKDGGKGLPSGTILGTTDTQTLTNKTLSDSTTYFQNQVDNTKKLQFDLSAITPSTTISLTIPDSTGTIALTSNVHYIGTTSIALNRSSASQTLTGVSIDGNSGTVTNGFYTTSSFYIGTTSIPVNRVSAVQSLTGISIDGNAGTVTNGVYTTGTYSNPSWITGLAWSKISSTPTTLSGYGITDAIDTSATAQTKSGNLTAAQFIKSGGTSSEFLKADGSVDSSTYLTTSSASSTYLTQSNAASTYAPIASPTFTGTVTLAADPSAALEAATKQYVDAATAGLNVHASVKAATTTNITLATDVENGDVLDGITLATGNRILIKNQTTKSQNGVYVVAASGAPTRATDYDSTPEVDAGDFIFVEGGTVNGKTGWVQTNTITTIGSDNIEFTQFTGVGTYTAGDGLDLTVNDFSVDSTVARRNASNTFTADQLISVNSSNNALEIRQIGTGNALVVEDDTNPDATPFVINASGQTVIGHTASVTAGGQAGAESLQILGTGASASTLQGRWSADNNGAAYTFFKSRGTTIGTFTTTTSGDIVGRFQFNASDGTTYQSVARIDATIDAAVSSGITPGRLVFNTSNTSGTLTERMRIDSDGDVGIGTASPGAKLQVDGSASGKGLILKLNATTPDNSLEIQNSSSTVISRFQANGRLSIGDGINNSSYWVSGAGSGVTADRAINLIDTNAVVKVSRIDGDPAVELQRWTGTTLQAYWDFYLSSTDTFNIRRRTGSPSIVPISIDSSGNVGIGTTPSVALDVYRSGSNSVIRAIADNALSNIVSQRSSTDVSAAFITLRKTRGTAASPTTIVSGDSIGYLSYDAYDGTSQVTAATIRVDAEGTISTGVVPGRMMFNTANASGTVTERMRIDSSGNVGIGTTPSQKLHLAGGTTNWLRVDDTTNSAFNLFGASGGFGLAGTYSNHPLALVTNSTARITIDAAGVTTFAGQLISSDTYDAATGGGQIYLNANTGNRIEFNNNGSAAPAFTTRSAGTKILLNSAISGSATDYAFGIETNTLWSSVPTSSQSFKWYGGTTNVATLTGAGAFTTTGRITGSADLHISSGISYFNTAGDTNGTFISTASGRGFFALANSTSVGLTVKGFTAQTGNLQEWQNSSATILAKVDSAGNFSAISKSFDIPHPTKENMRLRYGSLEGPENGVYVRGKSKENVIELPDYWTGLVDADSITVSITPIGKKQDIYVDKIEDNKVYLGGKIKEYFFTIFAERKDVDKLIVEY